MRVGQFVNTGVQIDAGDTNTFFGCSFEGINAQGGLAPNNPPVAIKIPKSSLGQHGADNNNNEFFGAKFEGNTWDVICDNGWTVSPALLVPPRHLLAPLPRNVSSRRLLTAHTSNLHRPLATLRLVQLQPHQRPPSFQTSAGLLRRRLHSAAAAQAIRRRRFRGPADLRRPECWWVHSWWREMLQPDRPLLCQRLGEADEQQLPVMTRVMAVLSCLAVFVTNLWLFGWSQLL